MTFQEYEAIMKKYKQPPMSEEQFNIMQGINTYTIEPCFLSPKYTKLKAVEPSLKEHEARVKL